MSSQASLGYMGEILCQSKKKSGDNTTFRDFGKELEKLDHSQIGGNVKWFSHSRKVWLFLIK
jgi:hypothetical protein